MEELLNWAKCEPTLRRFTIEWVPGDDGDRFRVTVWSMKSDGSGARREPSEGTGSTLGWAATNALRAYYPKWSGNG